MYVYFVQLTQIRLCFWVSLSATGHSVCAVTQVHCYKQQLTSGQVEQIITINHYNAMRQGSFSETVLREPFVAFELLQVQWDE